MNKFVRTKSPTRSKFYTIFFEQLHTGWNVVVHLYCGFSLWRQMAPQQSAKFKTTFFVQFCISLRKDNVANYASIWMLFLKSVSGPDVLCNALNISQIRLWTVGMWRHKIRKIAVEILQSVNNQMQSLREILCMVIIDIVINTLLGRLTLDPAGMHCPAWDDAFVSS